MPDASTGLSPSDLFSRSRWPHSRFQDCHVWGCPVYVLNKDLADGKKLPRWKPRSARFMFLGLSPAHASSVPLVLNLETGAVTPQFHIVFDDWFNTVTADPHDIPNFTDAEWTDLLGDHSHSYHHPDDTDASDPMDGASFPSPRSSADQRHFERAESAANTHQPGTPLAAPPIPPHVPSSSSPPTPPSASPPSPDAPPPPPPSPIATPTAHQPPPEAPPTPSHLSSSSLQRASVPNDEATDSPSLTTRRYPTRNRRSPSYFRAGETNSVLPQDPSGMLTYHSVDWFAQFASSTLDISHAYVRSPLALAARTKDPDILTFDEAMRPGPELDLWKQAMQTEIDELVQHGTWEEVDKATVTGQILPGTWTFKRKRTPDGQIKKYKARWCLRGDLQKDVGDNFSPVVSWPAVRLMLVLSLALGWVAVSLDFNNAFVQAYLPAPLHAHLPRGFQSSKGPSTCLRLIKSLYGDARAPRLFYDLCESTFLRDISIRQSAYNPCLFFSDRLIVVLYVDDCGICRKEQSDVDNLVKKLRDKGLGLTVDGTLTEFLGIKFHQVGHSEFHMTQCGLMDKVVKATGF